MSMLISASSVMNRAYAGNLYFKDGNYRKNRSNHEVVSADHKAMLRALKRLERLDFESEDVDDTKAAINTVIAYLDVYNNTVSSAMESDSSHIRRTAKNMKALMKEYGSSLENIGVQIKSDGTVKVDKNKLQKATARQTAKVFGNSDYISGMNQLMKKLRNQVNRETPRQESQPVHTKSGSVSAETSGSNLNLLV